MVYALVGAVSAPLVCLSVLCAQPAPVGASETNSITNLVGRWAGSATVTPVSGPIESIKCVITYFPSEDGTRIKQNVRCKGPSTSFDAATQLQIVGGAVTGSWQDNVYSLTGSVQGSVTPSGFDVTLLGRYFAAKMRVVSSHCEQSITVTPDNAAHMKELAATLRKC
ncbi:MAG TPA: hypothetical protein VG966_03010 [Hyphomicrobiaceae bacterium]|jgi:hypothetical protein|nr:hypothetical protein [Hyphomicrobiaceae bacterium]